MGRARNVAAATELSVSNHEPNRSAAKTISADTDGCGARVHRDGRAGVFAEYFAPAPGALESGDCAERDGGSGRRRLALPAAYFCGTGSNGGGVSFFRGAGGGAGYGKSGRPAMDSSRIGSCADAGSGDG